MVYCKPLVGVEVWNDSDGLPENPIARIIPTVMNDRA